MESGPIDSENDIIFAVADVLNEAEENGIDPDDAREAALGYVRGRQTDR